MRILNKDNKNNKDGYEEILFNFSDYFILFFDKFCHQIFKICKKKTKNFNSRNDLLKKLYKIGEEKINNEFSIERVLYTLR